jgi:hypothetical protein
LQDGLSIPEEVRRREDRVAKIKQAVGVIEERARERLAADVATYQSKLEARRAHEKATGKKPKGKDPKPPQGGPGPTDQFNFTDPESRIMKAGSGQHFEQAYNAQASVEIESRLIVGQHLVDAPNDKVQLVPAMAAISSVVESIAAVLVDNGYYSEAAVNSVESQCTSRAPLLFMRRLGAEDTDAASSNWKIIPTRLLPRQEPQRPKSWPIAWPRGREKHFTGNENRPSSQSSA